MKRSKLMMSLLLGLLVCGAGRLCGQTTVVGDWQTTVGAVVHVFPCRDAMCFKIARLAPTRVDPKDGKNKDSVLRSRELCGLTIGSGFRADGPGHFASGEVYDPDSGHSYQGTMTLKDGKLEMRGYVGISLFGITQTWNRVPERSYAGCR